MIAELEGMLRRKDALGVVVSCQGVGYGVAMSLTAISRLGEPGSEIHLFIHTHLTQEALRLYGFVDSKERRCFEQLLGTTGVGPRLALAILSTLTPDELAVAVADADKGPLIRIPGVGAKKAERLLVELKGRVDLITAKSVVGEPGYGPAALSDLVSALNNLGFAVPQAEAMARQARQDLPKTADLALLVRHALRGSYRGGKSARG